MNPSRARHHGPCKHCGKRKRLLPGDPRLCRECAGAAAAWFLGERSVLEKEEVLAASPRLLLQHLFGYRDGREAPVHGGLDLSSGPRAGHGRGSWPPAWCGLPGIELTHHPEGPYDSEDEREL